MIYIMVVLTFASSFLLCRSILYQVFYSKQMIQERLSDVSKTDSKTQENELGKPLFVRVFRPVLDRIGRSILKITPKEITTSLEKKILMAGNPNNLSVKDVINIQGACIVCLPVITAAAGYSAGLGARTILFIFAEIAFGLVMPRFILDKIISERQKKIQNSLPDILDLLTVSVEAGLGFDGALAKVADKMPGPLASEFGNVLQEVKVGKQKKDALKGMAERVGLQDLTAFIGSIIQADQFGVGIGGVLRVQSEQMRQKKRQRAQEKAMKAPVKMLLPMVLFIFPTLFIVLLGPVVIQVMDQFAGK